MHAICTHMNQWFYRPFHVKLVLAIWAWQRMYHIITIHQKTRSSRTAWYGHALIVAAANRYKGARFRVLINLLHKATLSTQLPAFRLGLH